MNYFVTAIGTDSGKTVVSAMLSEALRADYWKPIQSGYPSDTETVQDLVSNPYSVFHTEAYRLQEPASPHQAARKEGIEIRLNNIWLPETGNDLIIEGAGGLMVPLNKRQFMIDLIEKVSDQVILVANLYLGSINHTLLTIDKLKRRNITVKGIVFNGRTNRDSEEVILQFSQYRRLMHLPPGLEIDRATVKQYAFKFLKVWNE
ncbi:MAG: dethiobiotin synthase [Cyclobacteriaceae bacterium]